MLQFAFWETEKEFRSGKLFAAKKKQKNKTTIP